jgi:hypothetical protein
MSKALGKFGIQTIVFLCVLGIASKFAGPASLLIALAVAHKVLR